MRRLLLLMGLFLGLAPSFTFAGNLIVNGDFETGSYLGWNTNGSAIVVSNPSLVIDGAFSAELGGPSTTGTCTQVVAATPGATYILTYAFNELGTGSYTVDVTGSNTLVNYTSPQGLPNQVYLKSHVFTADSSILTIQFAGNQQVLFDDITLLSGSFANPGAYSGTVKVTDSIPERKVSASHVETVAARITSGGDITLLQEPSGTYHEGVFVGSSLYLDGQVNYNLRANTLEFATVYGAATSDPGNDTSVTTTSTNAYILHRTGK